MCFRIFQKKKLGKYFIHNSDKNDEALRNEFKKKIIRIGKLNRKLRREKNERCKWIFMQLERYIVFSVGNIQ